MAQISGPQLPTTVTPGNDLRAISALSLRALVELNGNKAALPIGDVNQAPKPMTLGEAAQSAYRQSYVIQAADAGSAVASAQRMSAIGGLLPQFDARFAIGIERSAPASIVDTETGTVVPVDTHQRRDLVLTLSQPVFDWAAWNAIVRAGHVRNAAEADASGARDDEGLRVVQAYFTLLQAALSYEIAKTHHQRLQDLQRWMSGRVAGGGASVADGQQVDARVLSAASLLEQQGAARDQALIALEQLTGARPSQLAIPTGFAGNASSRLDEAMERAARSNPSLRALYENERASRSDHASALGSYLPRLSVEVSQTGAMNAGGDPGWRRDQRVMAVATWSFTPLSSAENARAASAKARQYHYQRLDQERSVQQALRVAFSALSSVTARVETARKELDASDQVARSFDEQFAAGRKSLLEVLDAYDRLYQARGTMLQASVSGALLNFQVLRVTGELSQSLDAIAREAR